MAYNSGNMKLISSGYYEYQTQDSLATILATGYFSDFASTHSGAVGDVILVTDGTFDVVPTSNRVTLKVNSLSGNAATAVIDGSGSRPRKTLTAASTLTGADSGFDFYLDADTEFATTLMAPADLTGEITFTVADAPSGADYTVVTASSANIIAGHVVTSDVDATVDGSASTDADTISFVDGTAVKGDTVTIRSDGTSLYVVGSCDAVGGITLTQAS